MAFSTTWRWSPMVVQQTSLSTPMMLLQNRAVHLASRLQLRLYNLLNSSPSRRHLMRLRRLPRHLRRAHHHPLSRNPEVKSQQQAKRVQSQVPVLPLTATILLFPNQLLLVIKTSQKTALHLHLLRHLQSHQPAPPPTATTTTTIPSPNQSSQALLVTRITQIYAQHPSTPPSSPQ